MADGLKPLGRKAYGHIAHLPNSRMGPADHHCDPGQAAIALVKTRDRHERVIVTEKLDGSNVAVAKIGGQILALGRAGFLAASSPHEQHHHFATWVERNRHRFGDLLAEGERVNGEWLALAHGTRYRLPHEPFVAFDMMVGERRLLWDEIAARCAAVGVITARVLHDGGSLPIDAMLPLIETSGHGAVDPVEGAVWRVERKGRVLFMVKWVRPDKVDGKYLSGVTGHPDVWHWRADPIWSAA